MYNVSLYISTNTYHYYYDNSYFNRCEVISHCGFDLHFSDDKWLWTPFCILFGYLYIFSGKISVQVPCPFLIALLLFGLLSCVSSSYVLQGICKPLLQWHPTPVLLPGKSHGWRSLVGCSPWFCYKSDTTEWLHFHFSLSRNGEGNSNPLQCSCLENPRDGGAWWAAVYGVTQSRTWLKWLSSSIEYRACRYFLLFLRLSFNSVDCLFCSAEAV